jgi:hypothetical protein
MLLITSLVLALILTACGFSNKQLYLYGAKEFSGETVASCNRECFMGDNLHGISIAFMLVDRHPDFHDERFVDEKAVLLIPYIHKDGMNRELEITAAYNDIQFFYSGGKNVPKPTDNSRYWGKYGKYVKFFGMGDYKYAFVHVEDVWACPEYVDTTSDYLKAEVFLKPSGDVAIRYYIKTEREMDGNVWLDTWIENVQDPRMFMLYYPEENSETVATRKPVFYLENDSIPNRKPDDIRQIAWAYSPADSQPDTNTTK